MVGRGRIAHRRHAQNKIVKTGPSKDGRSLIQELLDGRDTPEDDAGNKECVRHPSVEDLSGSEMSRGGGDGLLGVGGGVVHADDAQIGSRRYRISGFSRLVTIAVLAQDDDEGKD